MDAFKNPFLFAISTALTKQRNDSSRFKFQRNLQIDLIRMHISPNVQLFRDPYPENLQGLMTVQTFDEFLKECHEKSPVSFLHIPSKREYPCHWSMESNVS